LHRQGYKNNRRQQAIEEKEIRAAGGKQEGNKDNRRWTRDYKAKSGKGNKHADLDADDPLRTIPFEIAAPALLRSSTHTHPALYRQESSI